MHTLNVMDQNQPWAAKTIFGLHANPANVAAHRKTDLTSANTAKTPTASEFRGAKILRKKIGGRSPQRVGSWLAVPLHDPHGPPYPMGV